LIALEVCFWVCALLLAHTHVLYPAAIASIARLRPRPIRTGLTHLPEVSLIVACHDEVEVIGERVRNAFELDYPAGRLELIVASDGSRDSTVELARAAGAVGTALPPHAQFTVDDGDWVRATQAQFRPIEVAERLWIVPSWCDPVDVDAINVVLDPGLAFGTGSHPTTRLCIRWLARELHRGDSVLDYGCGSGILAIIAAKLGASRVIGTDIDPQAIAASRDNAHRNRVDARFAVPDDPLIRRAERFDVVVANILANPLRLLAPSLAARVAIGGRVVLSGILAAQAPNVIAAYTPWFRIAVQSDDQGWVALAGTRLDVRPA
jgi:ribosomal protein L11 methyltransferase